MRPQSEYSTFGTFGPPPSGAAGTHMAMQEEKFVDAEKGHNVAPSISSTMAMNIAGYSAASGAASRLPPSEAVLDEGPMAIGAPHLHERPKYVFGQNPEGGETEGGPGGDAGEHQQGDPSSAAYDERYAQPHYEDSYAYSNPGYQDAERAYQATASASAAGPGAGGYYDQNGYYYPAGGHGGDPRAYVDYSQGQGQDQGYHQQQGGYQPQQPPQHAHVQGHAHSQSQGSQGGAYGGM